TCKIKLIGKTDVERDTFPFAIPVNVRYQSVQGVTISMIKPINKEGKSDKKTELKPQANIGAQIKLMIVLNHRNVIFKKTFINCCNGIVKNNAYSINNRNGVIRFSAYCSMMFTCPNKRPKLTANNIIKVCSLSNTPIKNSILLKTM